MSDVPSPGFARNPGKIIVVEPFRGTVTVSANGVTVASSKRAKVLGEPPYAPAFYIPFDDIDFRQLQKTDHSTHCPYKGDASYWTVVAAAESGANAMWAYEHPFREMSAIGNHGAFYPDKVTIRST